MLDGNARLRSLEALRRQHEGTAAVECEETCIHHRKVIPSGVQVPEFQLGGSPAGEETPLAGTRASDGGGNPRREDGHDPNVPTLP